MTVNEASFTDGVNTDNAVVPTATAAQFRLALICAMARNRVIGRGNTLPWHLPADMKHFRELTTGHVLLMGRKTFESLGRPLPNRTNIVITGQRAFAAEGALVAHSLNQALAIAATHVAPGKPEVFVIGGETLYAQLLPHADRLYITLVETEVDGDAWFPQFDPGAWQEREHRVHRADDKNPYTCVFQVLERKTPPP